MENRRNYYRVLHVQRDAPVEIIKISYRTMMHRLKMHPDLGGDHWTATVINEAYATLSDPVKRAAYDRELFAPATEAAGRQQEDAPRTDWRHDAADSASQDGAHCPFCDTPHNLSTIERDSLCGRCESPLSEAVHDTHDEATRRAVARMPRSFPLTFVSDWPAPRLLHGCAVDLSPSGMRFLTDHYLPIGSLISIDADVCSAVARVRGCNMAAPTSASQYEVGVQFVTLRFHRTQGGFVSITA